MELLFALRDLLRWQAPDVVIRGAVEQPCDGGVAGAVDGSFDELSGFNIEDIHG